MTSGPLSLRLTGAMALRDGALQQRSVAIEDGRITKGPLPEVNLSGYLVLPGIIDLHSQTLARKLADPQSKGQPFGHIIRKTEKDAAAQGITTAWLTHSIGWEGDLNAPDVAEANIEAHRVYAYRATLDLRIKLQCDMLILDLADRLLAMVQRHNIDYVIFSNALKSIENELTAAFPHQMTGGVSPEEYLTRALNARHAERLAPRYLCQMAQHFDTCGVTYGSLHDPDGETREMFSMMGAKTCELPIRRTAAALARAVSDPVILSAEDMLKPGTPNHIPAQLCDALVSGNDFTSIAKAAFALAEQPNFSLAKAWNLVSKNPAEILRLTDRGVIDYGKRADLLIVNAATQAIEATICGGKLAYLSGNAANRFRYTSRDFALAAE